MADQVTRNQKLSPDRVFVESHLEGFRLFILFGSKWRWNERRYSSLLRYDVAITVPHIVRKSLRCSDRALYNFNQNRVVFIGETQTK